MKKWELVDAEPGLVTYRAKITGGYIYRTETYKYDPDVHIMEEEPESMRTAFERTLTSDKAPVLFYSSVGGFVPDTSITFVPDSKQHLN